MKKREAEGDGGSRADQEDSDDEEEQRIYGTNSSTASSSRQITGLSDGGYTARGSGVTRTTLDGSAATSSRPSNTTASQSGSASGWTDTASQVSGRSALTVRTGASGFAKVPSVS